VENQLLKAAMSVGDARRETLHVLAPMTTRQREPLDGALPLPELPEEISTLRIFARDPHWT
jgi:hypothetical protein